jgi:hypothetical protein
MRAPNRVIQTFIRTCAECPRCHYYSGGMYECGITLEAISAEDKADKVGENCPLPYAGPPITPAVRSALGEQPEVKT